MNGEQASKKPAFRKLRGYAFDPSLSLVLDTVQVNNLTYRIDWEDLDPYPDTNATQANTVATGKRKAVATSNKNTAIAKDTAIEPNRHRRTVPAGDYIEIIDLDPASDAYYPPVDLNDLYILAQDGLDPSVSDPQFHQQMVYAVIMNTIKNFEKALGRRIQWASHIYTVTNKGKTHIRSEFVRRLRVYPHALRQANAYYDPNKKSLLFGYFPAQPANPKLHLPGGTVFTCLSHDIIAHETTHGILDGLHRRYIEDTNPDTRAFHEAFADIVALFQHFTFPDVLKHQIAKTRGDLRAQNLLGELAQEFGKAMGNYSGLRDAIGERDENGFWKPLEPNPEDYATKMEFHDRGAILVAAIFDAFLSIYRRRIRSLLRVATGGSGILSDGDLHPDMVNMLADTASDTASRILRICIRAIDYCPPIDVNFGDFLRAIITADVDMVAEDERNYRVAFIEAFQKRGIFPSGIKTMSVETLKYDPIPESKLDRYQINRFTSFLKSFKDEVGYIKNRKEIYDQTEKYLGQAGEALVSELFKAINGSELAKITGLVVLPSQKESEVEGFNFSPAINQAMFQVENLWLASRVTPDDRVVNHVILTILQRKGVIALVNEDDDFVIKGHYLPSASRTPKNGFIYRGGCTLIFDLDEARLKYAIKKDIHDVLRMEEQYRYQNDLNNPETSMYFSDKTMAALSGPFAFMHSSANHIQNK